MPTGELQENFETGVKREEGTVAWRERGTRRKEEDFQYLLQCLINSLHMYAKTIKEKIITKWKKKTKYRLKLNQREISC